MFQFVNLEDANMGIKLGFIWSNQIIINDKKKFVLNLDWENSQILKKIIAKYDKTFKFANIPITVPDALQKGWNINLF